MRTIRLYVDTALQAGSQLALPDAAADHALRVLRLRTGDALTLFNGDGCDYACIIEHSDRRSARVRVNACTEVGNESPLTLTLVQAVARGEKMDWIVQKATELGIARIVPVLSERSEVRLDARRADKRLDHWRAVAASACEQSGRARLPLMEPLRPLDEWITAQAGQDTQRLVLSPDSGARLAERAWVSARASVAVGPEGGWSQRDLSTLQGAGFETLQLGPRVLRTETAGLAAIAAMQALHGDL